MPYRVLDATERHCCYLARRLNRAQTAATVRRIEKQAAPFQPFVNALRPAVAEFGKVHCEAVADALAVESVLAAGQAYAERVRYA